MEFKLFGPLAIEVGGRQIEPGGTRQRGLLAILLLHRGEVVSAERLIEELYGTQPPASAATSLRAHVSRLRRALGGSELLRTRAGGYVLEVEKDSIDAQVFERLLEQGRSQRASGNAAQAAATLRQALELWRGPPLADFAYADFAQSEIARLDELRLAAIEERIEAELDLGHHAELVGELERLVRDYPLRERLRGHLMLALYRSGRQAEALASFQDARRILVDQLGIEPGSDLRALQQAILRHEVDLDLARTRPARPPRFPPALGALPVGLTRLVGRAQDVEEICELMRGDVRILTLTGPGGIGKTRVAIEAAASVAREFDDGARFVPLAPLSDPELVVPSIANVLAVRQTAGEALLEALKLALRDASLLLVLDNCEHLLEAAPVVSELAAAAPGLRVLATSRAPLHLGGEHLWPVPPLALPTLEENGGLEGLATLPSIALFVERARAVEPAFRLTEKNASAVARVCVRLDGVPLAIELAAARVPTIAPEAMVGRLDRALPLLAAGPRDAPARQRALESTIAWSYDLLPGDLQETFRRLSVFSGGWFPEAAESVSGASWNQLAALVDTSLVRVREVEDDRRFGMLATIREYADERLDEAGERDDRARHHAEYYLALAESLEPELLGQRQAEALARLEVEHDNLRAALAWSLETGSLEVALRLGCALWRLWGVHGHFEEGRLWFERAIQAVDASLADISPGLVSRALAGAARMNARLGRFGEARAYAERSLELSRSHGDLRDIEWSLTTLSVVLRRCGDYDGSGPLEEEALAAARDLGDHQREATALHNLGYLSLLRRDHDHAEPLFRQSAELYAGLGNQEGQAMSLLNLALVAIHHERLDDAAELLGQSLAAGRELGSREIELYCLEGLASIAAARHHPETAAGLLGCAEELRTALSIRLQDYEQALHDATVRLATSAIGDQGFADAFERGRSMTVEEAIDAN